MTGTSSSADGGARRAIAAPARQPAAPARARAVQTRNGVAGVSVISTPSGASASLIAQMIAAGVVCIAPSPQPFAPSGVTGEGVTVKSRCEIGTSWIDGTR